MYIEYKKEIKLFKILQLQLDIKVVIQLADRYINWVCRIVFLCYLELKFKVNQIEMLA